MSSLITRISGPRRGAMLLTSGAALFLMLALAWNARTRAQEGHAEPQAHEAKVRLGFELAPVELDLRGKNPALVGLGSYIANSSGRCIECHTWPNFVPGGDPFLGQPMQVNAARHLAGGRVFPNGAVSRNLTPDPETGLPADLTFDEFETVMRTGIDLDRRPPHIPSQDLDLLQIMPWPVFRNMSSRDLRAIYEYLSAVPSVE